MSRKGYNSRSKSVQHVESPTKNIELLNDEIKNLKSENLELAHQNESLNVMMSSKEATWKETQAMQADLEDEVKDLKLQVKDRDKLLRKLSSRPRNTEFETERVKEELNEKLNQIRLMELSFNKKVKDTICEKDAVIAKMTKERVALGLQNLQLMTKLRAIQREAVSNQSEWKTEITALEDSVKAEQAQKEACFEKIKKLENLLQDTEEKWAAKHQDCLNKERKMEDVILEKDAVIVPVTNENVTLDLGGVQAEVFITLDDVNTEQEVKEDCTEKMEDTEEKFAGKQQDIINQANNME